MKTSKVHDVDDVIASIDPDEDVELGRSLGPGRVAALLVLLWPSECHATFWLE